ncbi:non-specific lipid-transfer protein-like [Impatiens glandulifera]|uniref:non-specific lipid-transfer protein-like n=1 Tax=Impatiens glandulifera TaxID=253017 RepID=UPI001FB05B4A|nr:non-specific lipid-transfer protein-like [Impatiens glandulifera]
MMKGSIVFVFGLLVISSSVMLLMPTVESAVTCQDAVSQLSSCSTFLRNPDNSASPSLQCCLGAKALDKIASASQSDRKILCQCLKQTAQADTTINYNNAKKLPKTCQLVTNIPIDPHVDCNK